MNEMSPEDAALTDLWTDRFQQPLPVQGRHEMIIEILIKAGVAREVIERAIAEEKSRRLEP